MNQRANEINALARAAAAADQGTADQGSADQGSANVGIHFVSTDFSLGHLKGETMANFFPGRFCLPYKHRKSCEIFSWTYGLQILSVDFQ